jgi:hypothetical protein
VIEATENSPNGFHIRELQRTLTEGEETVTHSLRYEYDDDSRYDPRLQHVTYRRQGSWLDLKRMAYTYYGENDPYGPEGDLKTVTEQSWNGTAWEDVGTTMYRYYTAASAGWILVVVLRRRRDRGSSARPTS